MSSSVSMFLRTKCYINVQYVSAAEVEINSFREKPTVIEIDMSFWDVFFPLVWK